MARSKDPLASATTTIWTPVLRELGFRKYTSRSFGRVVDDQIFQYIDLQLSANDGKEFAVNYASMLMTRLQEHVSSTTFRRLPRGKSNDGWWDTTTDEHANESMLDICDKTKTIAMPWFQKTSTATKLAEELAILAHHGNPHTFFDLGCCYATANNLAAATDPLREAIKRFQQTYDEFPKRTWAMKERSLAEELIAAIRNGTSTSLLSQWREQTAVNLRLTKFRASTTES